VDTAIGTDGWHTACHPLMRCASNGGGIGAAKSHW
jgi:hypothetical protein